MAINWGLAQPQGGGFDYLESLQALGQERSRDIQNRTALDRLTELGMQRQARPAIQQQIAAGDYRGAQASAVALGDYDLAGKVGQLGEDDRKRLAAEGELMGRAAFALKKMPVDARPAAFAAMAGRFRSSGFSPEELRGYSDFSDDALDRHIALSQSIRDHLAGDLTQARIDDVGTDNARADMLAGNTIRNTDDVMQDRQARRALTKRGQDMADARGRYSVGVASRDRQRGQDLSHQDRVDARQQSRAVRGRGVAPSNPPSMIPGATPEMPVTVNTVAQARLLPKGTYFRTPQGNIMRVPQ
jgi:hypothetical protein